MTREERELAIIYLEGIKEKYIEGEGYERYPLPEYYAIETAIKALEQEPILDKIRAEIEFKSRIILKDTPNDDWTVKWNECIKEVLEIIDKYRESEE